MAKSHMPAKTAVTSSFSGDVVFLRMPDTQRLKSSETAQASGPSSLVPDDLRDFPSAGCFSPFFWKTGQRHRRVLRHNTGLCGPDGWRWAPVNLGMQAAFPLMGLGEEARVSWVSSGLGLKS